MWRSWCRLRLQNPFIETPGQFPATLDFGILSRRWASPAIALRCDQLPLDVRSVAA
jgi:hypothetical protein